MKKNTVFLVILFLVIFFLSSSCSLISINENRSYRVTKRKEQVGDEYILKGNYFIIRLNYYENFLLKSKLWDNQKNYRILPKGTRIKLVGIMFKWHIRYLTDGKGFYYYRILTGRFKGKIIARGTYIDLSNFKLVKKIAHPKDIPIIYKSSYRNKKKKYPNYSNLNHINDPALPPFKDRIILKSSDFGF